SPSGSFIRPSASGKIRSARTLSASQSASRSESLIATPSSTSRPASIAATAAPSTLTAALVTRWTSARPRLGLAELARRLPWRDDVQVYACSQLEAGQVGQPRQDVDPP